MDAQLARVTRPFAVGYIEPIFIYLNKPYKKMSCSTNIEVINEAGLTVNLNRCKCFTSHIYYVDHVILFGLLKASTPQIHRSRVLERKTWVTKFQWLLKKGNFSCSVGPNSACVAASLDSKLREDQLKTFRVITDFKISALEMVDAESVEPHAWLFNVG